jgi:hypothetical protein
VDADTILSTATLDPDRAIATADADDLGRSGFAEGLADQIRTAGSSGLVVALTGAWGSGKTSLLNLVEEQLVAQHPGQEPITIVRFNPWLFSGAEQLVQRYFAELGAELKGTPLKKLGASLQDYGERLAPLGALPVAGKYLGLVSSGAKGLGELLKPDRSLEQQRRDISTELEKKDLRIVVLVDDIDRLEDDEIKQVMKLVRLVGDFPNIVYVLAFDAERVENVLGGEIEPPAERRNEGRRYLEKIVQLAYDVPAVAPGTLADMARAEIARTLRAAGIEEAADETETLTSFLKIIDPVLTTVREVRRYVNVLPFALRVLKDYVNPFDIVALEAARLFLPQTYAALPESAQLLTDTSQPATDEEVQEIAVALERLARRSEPHEDVAFSWASRVFPAARDRAAGSAPSGELIETWFQNRSVASYDTLRVYLEKASPTAIVATTDVDRIATRMAAGESVIDDLSVFDDPQVGDLLVRLPDKLSLRLGKAEAEARPWHAVTRSLPDLLNRTTRMVHDRPIREREARAFREVCEKVIAELQANDPDDACQAVEKMLAEVDDLRIRRLAIDGVAPVGSTKEWTLAANCGETLRAGVADQIVALSKEEILEQISYGSLANWAARADESRIPELRSLLDDEEIFIRYLETVSRTARLPALLRGYPGLRERLEAVGERLSSRGSRAVERLREQAETQPASG